VGVDRATTPRGVFEFVAPPGMYHVDALVISATPDGGIDAEEHSIEVEIEPCCKGKQPPTPPLPDPKQPKLDAVAALGRIQFGNAGCTATVIGPRRADGKWDVLTAAHCVSRTGQRGVMLLKDGRKLNLTVAAVHEEPDCCWCVSDETFPDLAYAEVARTNPAPGVKIWHMGYGIDQPGNREDGEITAGENDEGQLRMELSVSSGDSGGGIFRTDTNELISVVCCTSRKGAKANVWGCAAEVARRLRPGGAALEWTPIPIRERARQWNPLNLWR
jgi:hypothetical protein